MPTSSSFEKLCREADRKKKKANRAAKREKANGGAKPETPAAPPPSIEELEAAAGDLVSCHDILGRFGAEVESTGLVGETNNAKILYLALTSRLFERPVSIAIKGVSSVGKSFTVEQVLKFFPPAAYFVRTGMSERAIIYSTEDYRHRFIIIFEAAGMNSDMVSYLIRTLLSEGRVVYEVVEKTKEGLRTRRIEKEGPTGLITTTTAPKLHPENETRLLSLGVIDTPHQTKAVMQALADDDAASTIGSQWHALQAWLSTGERRVAVPFAGKLADLIPPVAVRLRRDFKLLLTLIRAHALLHRATRDRDNQGRIVATVADYAAVGALVEKLFSEGIEATVPATIIPHKEVGPARREINRLSRNWPRKGDELKGGILQPAHLASLIEVLFRHDAVMHACAIDVSREDDARVDQHKAGQCDGITKHLTSEHHPNLVQEVWDLRRVLERMSRQLYIQCVMMKELVRIASEEVTLYFAQRRPRELAKFEWTIDAKDSRRITSQEKWWRETLAPLLESASRREPFVFIKDAGFNYKFFDRSFAMKKDMVEGHDIKKMIPSEWLSWILGRRR